MVVKEIIYRRLSENEIKSIFDGEYWPSQIWNCIRKQYYERTSPIPEGYDVTRYTILGSALHNLIADLLKDEEGISVLSEVPIRITHPTNDSIVLSGRADDVIIVQFTKERYIIEVKTVEDLTDKLAKKFIPKLEHRAQLNLYLRAYPNSHGILLYIDRGNFEMEEIEMEFDRQLYQETMKRVEIFHNYITKREIPPAEAKQKQDFSWQCSFCLYKARCERDK